MGLSFFFFGKIGIETGRIEVAVSVFVFGGSNVHGSCRLSLMGVRDEGNGDLLSGS